MTDDLARWIDGLVEGRRGVPVQEKASRRVWQVELAGRAAFAKRGTGPKRGEIRRETENARALAAAGLGPEVLAAGRDGAGGEWLVTEQAGTLQAGALRGLLRRAGRGEPDIASDVAQAVRRLHDLGFAFPDLTAPHVFLGEKGVRFIDAARLERRGPPVPVRLRARDLAAFVFSSHDLRADRALRLRFIAAASPEPRGRRGELFRRVDAEIARLAARTRWRHAWSTIADPERYVAALSDAAAGPGGWHWHGWADLLDPALHRIVRTLPDRENRTLGALGDGRPRWYVKVYPPTADGFSPAMREVEAIERFRRAGIPVHRFAAHAEDVDRGSMVATEACDGEPLDDFLRRGVARAERRSLACQTARIWRRMRECGLRHRDAYACHVFVARTADPARHEIRLIDLTRAGLAPWPRERWFVKDAAQLWHGAKPAGATSRDAVAWLREHFRVPRLTRDAKRFARRVAAKEAAVAARQARKAAGR